jgi:metal-dependent amidase/aminoacylase/carboxypeptidase family protein
MCDDGMMARWNIQEVYGMHNMPGLPVGQFAIREGAFFAATDQFRINVTGKGGHAAKPHEPSIPLWWPRSLSPRCRPSPAATMIR